MNNGVYSTLEGSSAASEIGGPAQTVGDRVWRARGGSAS